MIAHPSILLILAAAVLNACSGLPAAVLPRRTMAGLHIALVFSCLASLAGLAGVALVFLNGSDSVSLNWSVLGMSMAVKADALSAFFLVPVLIMGALGPIYGLGYWPQAEHPENGRGLGVFWGLTVAGMVLLLVARHAVLFLMGWELMAISAFFLITTENHLPEVRKAGWVYFVATHLGTLSLFALFALFHRITGSFELRAIGASEAGLGLLTLLFFLTLVGFGLKAGIMPLHFWLPAAHANAPSHVSALLSGIMLKMGVYGVIRFIGFLPDPPVSWGVIVLMLGCGSGVLGVAFALGQHDLKRLLAYHSVENIGIILIGFGLALIGRSWHQPALVMLGMAGCLLHVWNHALFKSLLFLGAGSVIHAAGTREIDRMGGLAKTMPWTAAFFLVGAIAICGLPPLNGFVSEWFIYLGLFHAVTDGVSISWAAAALAAPSLALIGALALACFVKAYGSVFLGTARTPDATPHEAGWAMKLPMAVLAACCALIGLLPFLVAPILTRAILAWDVSGVLQASCPLNTLPLSAVALFGWILCGTCLLIYFVLARRLKQGHAPRRSTWSCGYAQATARMQYTSSSFARTLVDLFRFALHPRVHGPAIKTLFARPSRFESHVEEPMLDRVLLPLTERVKQLFSKALPLQRGLTHRYLIYVALMVVALLIWTLPLKTILMNLFSR